MPPQRHAAALLLAFLTACGPSHGGAPAGPKATAVSFVVLKEEPVTLAVELPGRTAAYETSDVRPQVNGLVRARLFQEGDWVKAGQALYQIDPATYQTQLASARAGLARARSHIAASQSLARRYGELVKINAISRQEHENAEAAAAQASAEVQAQSAALRSAQIDLARTTIRAPISGRIGRSIYTTGALVTAAQADPLTTIQRLDPIYVDIQQSSADLLRIREQIMAGRLSRGEDARVRLRLETGSTYALEGTLRFADVSVDPATGSQTIRAVFPNPKGLLLPGMFVRAELVEATQSRGLLVPQRAVGRDERGRATVLVVGAGNKAELRTVELGRSIGAQWLVVSGLRARDKVIVEGTTMLRPGMPIDPAPLAQRPGASAPAPSGGQ